MICLEIKGGQKVRHAWVVFTKVPAGEGVKTRLTTAEGGILEGTEATALYRACLKDLLLAVLQGLQNRPYNEDSQGELLICHKQENDRRALAEFLSEIPGGEGIACFPDQGQSFDQRMQSAAEEAFNRGFETCTIVGGDLPTFNPDFVQAAFQVLEQGRSCPQGVVVTAPCQEGGFSLVGFNARAEFNFDQVFYNNQGVTAMDMLVERARKKKTALGVLPMLPDLDLPVDLASLIPVVSALKWSKRDFPKTWAPENFIAVTEELGLGSEALPPDNAEVG